MVHTGPTGVNRLIADRFPWICAIWFHLALWSLLAGQMTKDRAGTPVPQSISVELFVQPLKRMAAAEEDGEFAPEPEETSPDSRMAALPPATVTPDAGESTSGEPERQDTAPASPPGWTTATQLHAASVLSDPRSAQAREALGSLVGADQVEQLCALEAMEQIRETEEGFRPTRLAPHAFRNAYRKKDMIIAPAAAIRSNRVWYEIAYRCRLNADGSAIDGFEFALGGKIDRSLWDEYGLAPIH